MIPTPQQEFTPDYPTEPVLLILADKKRRYLRYTAATVKRLKGKLGKTLLRGVQDVDEDSLPELIYEGLTDKTTARVIVTGQDAIDNGVPEGGEMVGPAAIAQLIPMPAMMYVLQQFLLAWSGSLPSQGTSGRPPVPAGVAP